jgi:hypothetical protein
MSRYRMFPMAYWDEPFLIDNDPMTFSTFVCVVTGKHSSREGYSKQPLLYLAADLLPMKEFIEKDRDERITHGEWVEIIIKSLVRLEEQGLIKYDFENEVLFVCDTLRLSKTSNASVRTSFCNYLQGLPTSPLLKDFMKSAEQFDPDLLAEIHERFGDGV